MKKYLHISMAIGVIITGVVLGAYVAFATTGGPNTAGTGADDSSYGSTAWDTPSNVTASDNNYVSFPNPSSGDRISHYLKATNLGFSIPAGATIDGIKVEIERKAIDNGTNYVVDSRVRIVKADASIGTSDLASTTHWSTTEAFYTYGSATELWGESWTATDINDSDFGVALSALTHIAGGP